MTCHAIFVNGISMQREIESRNVSQRFVLPRKPARPMVGSLFMIFASPPILSALAGEEGNAVKRKAGGTEKDKWRDDKHAREFRVLVRVRLLMASLETHWKTTTGLCTSTHGKRQRPAR